jgi:lysosomal acid lipase/cholesteryl ester hydrolase
LWRVVNKEQAVNKPYPVFLQHGLLDCSLSWFLHSDKYSSSLFRNRALPYILSKMGFDVWVGNNRGTKYSMQGSDRKDYWNFGFDELAKYDVPAFITGVLTESKAKKLIYIGHSQGSTQFKASLLEDPSIADKIQAFIALGPVVSL